MEIYGDQDYHLKVFLFGCLASNKQRILRSLRTQDSNVVQSQTIDIHFLIAEVNIDNLNVKFQLVKSI